MKTLCARRSTARGGYCRRRPRLASSAWCRTSSVAAIADPNRRDEDVVWTEEHWADPDKDIGSYARSKSLAERAAWDFVAENPSLELVAINPVFVIGPVFDGRYSASLGVVGRVVERAFPGVPPLGFSLVDVRDVAAAHLLAMTHPDAPGERFVLSKDFRWLREIAEIINAELAGPDFKPLTTRPLPGWVIRLVALFDSEVKSVVNQLGLRTVFDGSKVQRVLGLELRPVEESIVDTARSLIEQGAG